MEVTGWKLCVNKESDNQNITIHNTIDSRQLPECVEVGDLKSFFYYFFIDDVTDIMKRPSDQKNIYEMLKQELQNLDLVPDSELSSLDKKRKVNLQEKFNIAKNKYNNAMEQYDSNEEVIKKFQCELNKLIDQEFDNKLKSYVKIKQILDSTDISFEEYPNSLVNFLNVINKNSKPSYILKENIIYYLVQKVPCLELGENTIRVDIKNLESDYISIKKPFDKQIIVNTSSENIEDYVSKYDTLLNLCDELNIDKTKLVQTNAQTDIDFKIIEVNSTMYGIIEKSKVDGLDYIYVKYV